MKGKLLFFMATTVAFTVIPSFTNSNFPAPHFP